jgi:geranyl-CoA carboxylase alpha subunit
MFDRLLIANRGEIACRIAATARRLGLVAIGVHSEADRDSPQRAACDISLAIGDGPAADSYLRIDRLIAAARRAGAQAVHPGYGFLAENAAFAQAVVDAGMVWVGPPAAAMAALSDKAAARHRAETLGIAIIAGYDGDEQTDERLMAEARRVGLPVMIKACAGGGGRGMRLVDRAEDLADALAAARREAVSAFGDGRLIVERAVQRARHIEVQVFADAHGGLIHLGERDCSVQRRHQKLIEEAPSPALSPALRRTMGLAAVRLTRTLGYVGAGTVEFLVQDDDSWFFIEMNTRLQVEHRVTEALLGIDLVEWQLRIAGGERLPLEQDEALARFESGGHAVEARLCAEDPQADDLPQTGALVAWAPPPGLLCDHALADGIQLSAHYDPLLAKLVAHATNRETALRQLARGLDETVALGPPTNRALLTAVLRDTVFASGQATTAILQHRFEDRRASLASPLAEHGVIAAVWLAAHGTADLPDAWARSALLGPSAMTLPLRSVGDEVAQRWRVVRVAHRDGPAWQVSAVAPGATAADDGAVFRVSDAKWSRAGPVRVLEARVRDAAAAIDRRLRLTAVLQNDPDGRWLIGLCDGLDLRMLDCRLSPPARPASTTAGEVRAGMHGRVLSVPVRVGDTVAAGQVVAIVEAMKMEHALTAPFAGTVTAVSVSVGEQVGPSQCLVEVRGE